MGFAIFLTFSNAFLPISANLSAHLIIVPSPPHTPAARSPDTAPRCPRCRPMQPAGRRSSSGRRCRRGPTDACPHRRRSPARYRCHALRCLCRNRECQESVPAAARQYVHPDMPPPAALTLPPPGLPPPLQTKWCEGKDSLYDALTTSVFDPHYVPVPVAVNEGDYGGKLMLLPGGRACGLEFYCGLVHVTVCHWHQGMSSARLLAPSCCCCRRHRCRRLLPCCCRQLQAAQCKPGPGEE